MPPPPVQQRITIDDIQDGILLLKDGSLRAVLMTSSINFALKSSEEQDALIYKYQAFLNSLDFPIEILMLSRHLNIGDYLALIEQKRKEQPNELLQVQIAEYMDFIKSLVQVSNIMNQTFYVVVPLARIEKKEANFIDKLNLLAKKPAQPQEEKTLDELKTQLWQRVEYVASGLGGLGLKCAPLNTDELSNLFYHLYNMTAVEKPAMAPPEQKK